MTGCKMDRLEKYQNQIDVLLNQLSERIASPQTHDLVATDAATTAENAEVRRELIRAFVDHQLTGDSEKLVAAEIARNVQWADEYQEQLRLQAIQAIARS